MTDNEIIKALECCGKPVNEECCSECPYHLGGEENCHKLLGDIIDLINRQQAEIERLNEHYKNLAKASIRHAFDTENDRQLLHEYQNIFLGLGYGLKEVQDPELKEIKSWKDRAIWHFKRCDELNKELKTAKSEAIKEFAERLNEEAQIADCFDSYNMVVGTHSIENLLKEMVGDTE